MSDSGESTDSNYSNNINSIKPSLSLLAEFDELMRFQHTQRTYALECEESLLQVAEQLSDLINSHKSTLLECHRLQGLLEEKIQECNDLEGRLTTARIFIDKGRSYTRKVEKEKDNLEMQIAKVRDLLFKDIHNSLPNETREKLAFLNSDSNIFNTNGHEVAPGLSTIEEVNTTGSLLSDFSYSRSEDDLDNSLLQTGKTWKKHRPVTDAAVTEPAIKKRRSSSSKIVEIGAADKVRATTTLTVSKDGPITATSVIESIPPEVANLKQSNGFTQEHKGSPTVTSSLLREPLNNNVKQHIFQTKNLVKPDNCSVCEKRIRFGKSVLKCKDCRCVCHSECKNALPLPCIPQINTPTQKGAMGLIGDYASQVPPMVPPIIIHCINEIESRGLGELGIYRISASEKDVKNLKEKFLRGKCSPSLKDVDIHVICCTIKDFLRSLYEPLVTRALWPDFTRAVQAKDEQDILPSLYQTISELPQPNRDTLAYMVLHLQKVAMSQECKMPVENLAKIFGPTVIGYSSINPDPNYLLFETKLQVKVMNAFINLPSDYWAGFITVNQYLHTPTNNNLHLTPSTDSLLLPQIGNIFTPNINRKMKKKRRYFPSPADK